jgi:hypothetical protein
VSPARVIVPVDQRAADQVFTVTDSGRLPLRVDVIATEFTQEVNGDIRFQGPQPAFSAASWVRVSPVSFGLEPGHARRVKAHLSIPPKAEPGDHQLALLFRVPARSSEHNIAISGAVGTEVLVRVPGPVTRKISLGPLQAPAFADGGPIPLQLTAVNHGTVHRDFIRPRNLVAVVDNGDHVEFPSFTVLRDSARRVETQWEDPPALCLCRLAVTSRDGQGRVITAVTRVIVFPLRLTLGVLVTAVGLYLLTRERLASHRRRLRAREERIRREAYEEAHRDLSRTL